VPLHSGHNILQVPVLRAANISMVLVNTLPDRIEMPTDWMKHDAVVIVGGDGVLMLMLMLVLYFL
jgi:hypothetical protein